MKTALKKSKLTCKDPRDLSNPLVVIKMLLEKSTEEDKTKPPRLTKKIVF